jgi:hypothetical protein
MMRTLHRITALDFRKATGRAPVLDDLQRANCEHAGEPGHTGCGWCDHGQPVYRCETCMQRVIRKLGATARAQHG